MMKQSVLTPGLAAETLSNVLRKTFPASEFTKTRQTERIKSRQNNRDSSMIKPELSGIVPCLVRSLYLATGSDISRERCSKECGGGYTGRRVRDSQSVSISVEVEVHYNIRVISA